MTTQLYPGTHISKGHHPNSKGNNVNYNNPNISHPFIGTHFIPKPIIDSSGNAAALPLTEFFNLTIDDEKNIKLQDLLIEDSPLLKNAFSDNSLKSDQYKRIFQQYLRGVIIKPTTYEKNKQLLWPNNQQAISEDNYTCIVPLYPSSLTNLVYNKIQITRNNHKKDNNIEQQRYLSFINIAIIRLGGSKIQNISKLNVSQGGQHFLLPSLPPIFSTSTKSIIDTIFNNDLYWQCEPLFNQLYEIILVPKNTYMERNKLKEVMTELIEVILMIAQLYQQRTAGWSKFYQNFDLNQKYWLDPNRADLEGEEDFKERLELGNWHDEIAKQFASWVNYHCKQHLKKTQQDFSTLEFNQWRRIFKRILKRNI